MKVIQTDNFDRESVSHRLVCMKKELAWMILIVFGVLVIVMLFFIIAAIVIHEPIVLVAIPISALLLWAIHAVTKD